MADSFDDWVVYVVGDLAVILCGGGEEAIVPLIVVSLLLILFWFIMQVSYGSVQHLLTSKKSPMLLGYYFEQYRGSQIHIVTPLFRAVRKVG